MTVKSLFFYNMLVCVTFPVACTPREGSYELQSEAEGEVPVSPTDPAHCSAPTLAQEHLLPNQGAAHHERGSAAEVRVPLLLFCLSFLFLLTKCIPAVLLWQWCMAVRELL